MLDLPQIVVTEPVGGFDLFESLLDQYAVVSFLVPGPGQLVLVEDSELHSEEGPGGGRLTKC